MNMVRKRVCKDCLIPGCGAKYLVKLANHLANVHQLDQTQRKKYLQEAKLQPKVKVVIYDTEKSKRSDVCSTSETPSSTSKNKIVLNLSANSSVDATPYPRISGQVLLKPLEVRLNKYFLADVPEEKINHSRELLLRKEIATRDALLEELFKSLRSLLE